MTRILGWALVILIVGAFTYELIFALAEAIP
jgi:hypothetical protein